jgi:hypothetical protein
VDELPWLTHADFAGRVGETFEAPDAGQVLDLVETTDGPASGGSHPDGRSRNQFSLVFAGPPDRALAQGTVRLEHPDLGELFVFLVPIGPHDGSMRYEAAFA